jgi:hypothetical protein
MLVPVMLPMKLDQYKGIDIVVDDGLSVLQAAFNALEEAVTRTDNNEVLVHLLKEVISHLEHAGAVQTPSSFQERGIRKP